MRERERERECDCSFKTVLQFYVVLEYWILLCSTSLSTPIPVLLQLYMYIWLWLCTLTSAVHLVSLIWLALELAGQQYATIIIIIILGVTYNITRNYSLGLVVLAASLCVLVEWYAVGVRSWCAPPYPISVYVCVWIWANASLFN